ncbi:hypothetical protein RDABS01_015448 [Bienertia sinuspersici]
MKESQKPHSCICVKKIDRRLSGWKSKFLSLAGRTTFAQSTLSTMALYSVQSQRKLHHISWENIQEAKECGGLGFKSMRQANAAFLTKMAWRLLT